jgi:hypothetical protein
MLLRSSEFVPIGRENSDSTHAVVDRAGANIPWHTNSSGSELAPITMKERPERVSGSARTAGSLLAAPPTMPDDALVTSRAVDAAGRDRGPIRKQREVDVARRVNGSLTGALQSALECSGERKCGGKPQESSVRRLTEG